MADFRANRVENGHTKIKNVPIAVTPEGFWCCPYPVVFQKTTKTQNPLKKPKPVSPNPIPNSSGQKKQTILSERKSGNLGQNSDICPNDQDSVILDAPLRNNSSAIPERKERPNKPENPPPRKVSIEFGEPGTSDFEVRLLGKQGLIVKLSVHKSVLIEKSSFFANKIEEQDSSFLCIEINECEEMEVYVETVGLMYCKELKQQLIKQSVSRVLRVLKIAEQLGFSICIQSCLEYLEAAPWVGEEEEEKVVSSVLRLQDEGGIKVSPVLKRVSSGILNPPKDAFSHILELVLKSNEERARREMKSIVLKLLRENTNLPTSSSSSSSTSVDNNTYNRIIYASSRTCIDIVLSLSYEAASTESNEDILKKLSLEADNLWWLLEILSDRQAADEFAVMWANLQELASIHPKLQVASRYHISCITARLFVGIGKGQLLPTKDTRLTLLNTWLHPLINDYNWLLHGTRSFDRKTVEEGIGRTILTLPLEDQQSILLAWFGMFLKNGDSCPNLQKAFEVWWRRTFVRPYMESNLHQEDGGSMTFNVSNH